MIIHQREIAYSNDYQTFFEALMKAKAHIQKRFPEVSVEIMYNLAGQRGFATVQARYRSLADYEKIDAELDQDEAYTELLSTIVGATGELPVDQFYRIIEQG